MVQRPIVALRVAAGRCTKLHNVRGVACRAASQASKSPSKFPSGAPWTPSGSWGSAVHNAGGSWASVVHNAGGNDGLMNTASCLGFRV